MTGRIQCRASLAPASLEGRSVYATLITSEPLRHCAGEACDAMSPHYVRVIPSGVQHDGSVPLLTDHANEINALAGLVDEIQVVDDRLIGRLVIDEGDLGDKLLAKIRSGSLRAVSIGADVDSSEQVGYQGDYPLYEVRESRLRELSLVPVGRDRKALLMSEPLENTAKSAKADPVADIRAAYTAGENLGMVGEVSKLLDSGVPAASVPEALIRMSVEQAQIKAGVQNVLAQRAGVGAGLRAGGADVGAEIGEAIRCRLAGGSASNRWAYRSMVEMAEGLVAARGVNTSSMRPDGIIEAAFSPSFAAASHTTADFPSILRDATNKSLLAAFEPARSPLSGVFRKTDRKNFHQGYTARLGESPKLLEVEEGSEILHGTRTEQEETWRLKSYGRIFGLSRQALLNDDLSAFSDILRSMAAAAAATEGDVLWSVLSANSGAGATMSDGNPIFDSSNHGNVSSTAAAPSVASIGAAVELLRQQKGVGGDFYISVEPRYLLVGPKGELAARQAVASVALSSGRSEVNPWPLEVMVEPRIGSGTEWYVFGDKVVTPVGEYGHLTGSNGPLLASEENFDTAGMRWRVIFDIGAGAVDWRGAVRNPGA